MSPSINDCRKIIETKIDSIPESKIVLFDSLTVGDAERVQGVEGDLARGIFTLFCLIKEWNLDEELTENNVKKLNIDDMNSLMKQTSYGELMGKTDDEIADINSEKKTV